MSVAPPCDRGSAASVQTWQMCGSDPRCPPAADQMWPHTAAGYHASAGWKPLPGLKHTRKVRTGFKGTAYLQSHSF